MFRVPVVDSTSTYCNVKTPRSSIQDPVEKVIIMSVSSTLSFPVRQIKFVITLMWNWLYRNFLILLLLYFTTVTPLQLPASLYWVTVV